MNKDREFTESKTIKQNTKMKKRILGAALAPGETDWGNCTYYGCIVDFSSTCNVYSSIWGNLIKVCPNMRG